MRDLLVNISLVCVAAASIWAQDNAKSEMIDSFGLSPCDELSARSWNLVTQTAKRPGSRALVIADPKKGDFQNVTARFTFILASFQFDEIDDRVSFKIVNRNNDGSYEFWIIPSGATEPDSTGEEWNFPVPDTSKPFIFGYEDEINECPTFVPRKYAELLLANPGSRAHIVIKAGSWVGSEQAKGFADETIKTLVEKFKVDRKRIRTFYVRQTIKNSMTYAEFWFVPAKLSHIKTPRHERRG